VVQTAALLILEPIFEADFLNCSHGYRPGRSAHQALAQIEENLRSGYTAVYDADLQAYFDTIPHEQLMKCVEQRIADRSVLRLIRMWLKAVIEDRGEDGRIRRSRPKQGTPQGGVISPLLANIYLHYVFDLWVHDWRKQANGDVIVVRFADDFIVGFQYEWEARQFLTSLRERFAEHGLELHPDKTRLIEFGRHATKNRERSGRGKPETFNFLGFTHICSKTRKGKFVVRRLTMRKRFAAKLAQVKQSLRERWHVPVREVGRWLAAVIRGHMNYYAIPLNFERVDNFRNAVIRLWRRALGRRSQKGRVDWRRMRRIADAHLPRIRIVHPWPEQRLALKT
jgi:group II intron reverse transcriptase/maturase